MKMNERLEEYAQLLGRIAQKTDNIEQTLQEIKTGYHEQVAICRSQFVLREEFAPIATKVRAVVLAMLLGCIGALGTVLAQHVGSVISFKP